MSTSSREPAKYTVLRATVSALRLLRLVRFKTGMYGVLDGESPLQVEAGSPKGRRRAIAAFEETAAAWLRRYSTSHTSYELARNGEFSAVGETA